MPERLKPLLHANRQWAASMEQRSPGFFIRLAQQQNPRYMWIGCADSRVPANEITGLDQDEVFVHRNVANVVVHSDLSALSTTIQLAVEHLKVEHAAMIFSSPPQFGQCSMSRSNTRLSSLAQLSRTGR